MNIPYTLRSILLLISFSVGVANVMAGSGMLAAPTTPSSNLVFSNVGNTQMTLTWSSGDGAGRIVVMRAGSAVITPPVNGVDYTVYQSLSASEMVVYKGTGNSFVFTNDGSGPLVSGTNYYFEIFEYNGSGGTTEFLTSSTAVGNQTATVSTIEPGVGSGSLTFLQVGGNSMDLSWAAGGGAKRIVIAKQGSTVDTNPVDGIDYSLFQTIGNGNVVVYNGSGNSFLFNTLGNGPLTVSTTYHFAIYEYNGSGMQTNYNTSIVLTGSQTTQPIVDEPTSAVTGVTIGFRTDVPEQRIDISWSGGDGSSTLVVMRAGSPPDAGVIPTDGVDYPQWGLLAADHWICYKGSDNQFELKSDGMGDLVPSTTYYFRFFEFNGSGGVTNYLTSATFSSTATSLAASPAPPPSNLNFTSQVGTNQTVSWTNGGGTGRLVIAKLGSAVNYVPYDLPADATTYSVGQNLGAGNYVVYNGTGSNFVFSSLGGSAIQRNTTYHFAVIEYTGSGTTINYLTENGGDVLTGSVLTPNFAAEPTVAPSNLVFSNVSNSSMTLTWTNGNGSNRLVLVRKNSAVGSNPVDGTAYSIFQSIGGSGTVVYNGNGNSFVFNNDGSGPLEAGATYHFRIVEYNGNSNLTNYLTSSVLNGSQIALSGTTEPTVAASSLTFTNVQTNRMTLNWANGNGTSRIVVYRQGSPVTANPVDGVSYSNYQSLASGQIVVYNGTGSSFTFSNSGFGPLTPNTTYHFAIFEYNGSGSITNYLVSPNLIGSQTTLGNSTEPTVAASGLFFTSILNDEMTLNWTSGNGANRIVVAKAGSPVTAVPVDGKTYAQYTTLTAGEVIIYNGNASSYRFRNTGVGPLSPCTMYHYAIYEYNGTGTSTNYLTSSFLTGSQSTTGPSCRIGNSSESTEVESVENEELSAVTEIESFSIFPNPATTQVRLKLAEEAKRISIYSIGSQLVYESDTPQTEVDVDVTGFDRGMYIVQIHTTKGLIRKKLLVK